MGEMSDWMQSNWFELGSLLVQFAILATVAWYGRKALGILTASQVQDEAPQRLSPARSRPEGAGHGGGGLAAAWRNGIEWLQAPMGSGGVAPWHRATGWLQAPWGS